MAFTVITLLAAFAGGIAFVKTGAFDSLLSKVKGS